MSSTISWFMPDAHTYRHCHGHTCQLFSAEMSTESDADWLNHVVEENGERL